MRVLMISKACVVGTYQRKLEELARQPGIELTVIVPPSWRDRSGELKLERVHTLGYQLLVEPMRFNGNFHLHYFPTVGRRLRELCPTIVHIDEEPYNFATWHILWSARKIGARTVLFSWQNLNRRYPFPFSMGERWALRTADCLIAGTDSAAAVWREKGYRGPLPVIQQFGIDPDLFSPSPAKDTHGGGFVIGYVGRLVQEKGVDTLIEAAARLPGIWRLEIVGQGPERASLERLAHRLNVADRVAFNGQLPSTRLPALYRQLDVLVVPSRTRANWKEQFGRVIVEALACGVPVIGSDSGAIPDVVGDAGLIVGENDVDALTNALQSLMGEPDKRRSLSTAGRARALARYTHSQVAIRTAQIYTELALAGQPSSD
jgi:glycosyltransferase involved in cell wall biosynthesis